MLHYFEMYLIWNWWFNHITYSLNRCCRSSGNIKFVFDSNRIHCEMHQIKIQWNGIHQKTKCNCIVTIRHTHKIDVCLVHCWVHLITQFVYYQGAQEAIRFTCFIYSLNHWCASTTIKHRPFEQQQHYIQSDSVIDHICMQCTLGVPGPVPFPTFPCSAHKRDKLPNWQYFKTMRNANPN